ncbi:hypothetical protein O6H91_16G067200 [Diphasiastrum complanatum]|uniref:Uncharacterized protein n=1 Tax=Diphasiastrum complanatum TaxID=34168 RepID=A0ACC2BD54_DIPCM|nr:hypothetical protein O6H91_16G067200 [Diphasiastrum complanatum]
MHFYRERQRVFLPGGASLHSCMTPHGVDTLTYEKTVAGEDDSKPSKVSEDTLAFMFESSLTPKITPWAFNSPDIDPDYYKCWIGLRSHFDQGNANLKVTRQESPRSP